jgi:RNA-binding protein with serine-rich domain 1
MSESLASPLNTIVVSGLSFNVTEDHLREIFGNCGRVTRAKIARSEVGHSCGWGLVVFEDEQMAHAGIDFMNGGCIDGLIISARRADSSSQS